MTASRSLSATPAVGADVVARAARGDQRAFAEIMRGHNALMFRTARAILRDDAEAEDAVQEAYLRAFRSLGEYRGEAKLATWLARIAANEALMRLRKRARRSEIVPIQPGADEALEQAEDSDMKSLPEASAQRAEIRRLLESQIDALPDTYRTVFVLRAVEDLTVEEAAAILDLPAATVRTRYFRARSLLREALAQKIDIACEEAFSFAGERCDRIVATVLERLGKGT